jgi:hypothetical protein
MVKVKCTLPDCEFTTEDVSESLAIALLANHNLVHQAQPAPPAVTTTNHQAPKLDRPLINIGASTEEWNVFVRRWDVFCKGSGIDERSAPTQLFQCTGAELGDSLLKTNPQAVSQPLPQLLKDIRSLAVIPVATSVLRTELLQLHQERGETFRSFTTRVRGKAETCSFGAKCECGKNVDYTDHVIRDILINGIADSDIRLDILGTADILQRNINDLTGIVESKEMARNAIPSSNLTAVSSFRQQKAQGPDNARNHRPSQSNQSKQAICPDCKVSFNVYTEGARGWNSKPHKVCLSCFRARRQKKSSLTPTASSTASSSAIHTTEPECVSQIAAVHPTTIQNVPKKHHPQITLDHHVFSKGEWKKARFKPHPRASIVLAMDAAAQAKYITGIKNVSTRVGVSAIADTGAQCDVWSLRDFLACGFKQDHLIPVTMGFTAANRSPISIEGAFFATIQASNGTKTTSCRSMVYVSSCVNAMYLSYESLLNLDIMAETLYPSDRQIQQTHTAPASSMPSSVSGCEIRVINSGCNAPGTSPEGPCSCPQRGPAPQLPAVLPFPCTAENINRMKAWLLDRYASSTFNTCPHRALSCMEGPPIEIHVDPTAPPKACHTPSPVPLHWQQKVYDDLLRDEALGVIERVPYGEPVTWCHRMVITRKHDGTPRRTVDLSPLNKYCKRETFASEPPFHLARRVPKDTWKTVTDAWNGYHSVPLRESDRHLTTFITPFGRWRYTRAPQGFLSSGDGYNRRFDAILSSFERKERCVDDTIHYDTDLEQHWWRTIELLTRVGQAGIVLNPDKFQFCVRKADFAGFRVSDTTIEPLPKYLDAIRDFPTPTSTTDIRSWFGLVNQVSNYAQLREIMEPFKPFLSPRCQFSWSPILDEAFQKSKEAIIDSIRQGVEIFDVQRRTCLRPDWSKQGIGYFLLQQHCTCPSGSPDCCENGWKITLAGSRSLSSTEQRYAAIEGEALAVAWGLEQTRYFTQGCDNLLVVTDHKPLTKIFGDRTLDEITNSRLFRMKQRTLAWRFEIKHLPGKSNAAADATSRHPSPAESSDTVSTSIPDISECALMASIRNDTQEFCAITWSRLAHETAADHCLNHLLRLVERGAKLDDLDVPSLSSYKSIYESVYVQDGVLMFQDRVIVPESLRPQILKLLHSAHQGTSKMEQRARSIIYWPGMSKEISETREACTHCNRNAPSQASTPPIQSIPPSTPFEQVFADFCKYGGHQYLVVGDRLSGWVEVFQSPTSSGLSGATGLIRHLRTLFSTFGVPEELSSDGGPEFTASSTESFLQTWGVRHRISSAYFPQSNGRAEAAVKTVKRLLVSNTSPTGSLDHDRFVRAILQLRNTPDADCNVSPAQILFGRPLRDSLSFSSRLTKFNNPHISPTWRKAWAAKETALNTRFTRTTETLQEHTRALRPLNVGERVFIQNQHGPSANKWDKSGTIMECMANDQYRVKVDGSGRLTLRNRRFLRAFKPATPDIQQPVVPATMPSHAQYPVMDIMPTPTLDASPILTQAPDQVPAPTLVQDLPMIMAPGPEITNVPTPEQTQVPPAPEESHVPAPVQAPASTVAAEKGPIPQRPQRERRKPKRFEPESGKWTT